MSVIIDENDIEDVYDNLKKANKKISYINKQITDISDKTNGQLRLNKQKFSIDDCLEEINKAKEIKESYLDIIKGIKDADINPLENQTLSLESFNVDNAKKATNIIDIGGKVINIASNLFGGQKDIDLNAENTNYASLGDLGISEEDLDKMRLMSLIDTINNTELSDEDKALYTSKLKSSYGKEDGTDSLILQIVKDKQEIINLKKEYDELIEEEKVLVAAQTDENDRRDEDAEYKLNCVRGQLDSLKRQIDRKNGEIYRLNLQLNLLKYYDIFQSVSKDELEYTEAMAYEDFLKGFNINSDSFENGNKSLYDIIENYVNDLHNKGKINDESYNNIFNYVLNGYNGITFQQINNIEDINFENNSLVTLYLLFEALPEGEKGNVNLCSLYNSLSSKAKEEGIDIKETGITIEPLEYTAFEYMTVEEQNVYNYVLKKEGKEAANQFLKDLSDNLFQRKAKDGAEEKYEEFLKHPDSFGRIMSELGYAVENGVVSHFEHWNTLLTGDEATTVNEYEGQYLYEMIMQGYFAAQEGHINDSKVDKYLEDLEKNMSGTHEEKTEQINKIRENLEAIKKEKNGKELTEFDILYASGQMEKGRYEYMSKMWDSQEFQNFKDTSGNVEEWFAKNIWSAGVSLGNMLPSMVLSMALSPVGTVTVGGMTIDAAKLAANVSMFGSSAGGSLADAKRKGYDSDRAYIYAFLSGASEITTGYFLGSVPFVSRVANVLTVESSGHFFKSMTLGLLRDILNEIAEENLQVWIGEFLNVNILSEEGRSIGEILNEMKDTTFSTLLSTLISNGAPAVINIGRYTVNVTVNDIEAIRTSSNPKLALEILANAKVNPKLALEQINTLTDAKQKAYLVSRLSTDAARIEGLKYVESEQAKLAIIASLGSDKAKMKAISQLSTPESMIRAVTMLSSNSNQLKLINALNQNGVDFDLLSNLFGIDIDLSSLDSLNTDGLGEAGNNDMKVSPSVTEQAFLDIKNKLEQMRNRLLSNIEQFFSGVVADQNATRNLRTYSITDPELYEEFKSKYYDLIKEKYMESVASGKMSMEDANANLSVIFNQNGGNISLRDMESIIMNAVWAISNGDVKLYQNILGSYFKVNENSERSRLVDKISKLLGPNQSPQLAESILLAVNKGRGACAPTAVANTIYAAFANNPELFQQCFGFSMYQTDANGNPIINPKTNKKVFNDAELILDFYLFINSNLADSKNPSFFNFSDDGNMSVGTFSPGNLGNTRMLGANLDIIVEYLKSRGVECEAEQIFDELPSKYEPMDVGDLKTKVNTALASDNQFLVLSIGTKCISKEFAQKGLNFVATDGSEILNTNDWSEGMGHDVMILGSDEDGVYIGSWGKEYYVSYKDLENVRCVVKKITYK